MDLFPSRRKLTKITQDLPAKELLFAGRKEYFSLPLSLFSPKRKKKKEKKKKK
jgi:hypothetical protein